MARADADDLQQLLPLLRQLRAITGLREDKPGIFYLKRDAFLHFHRDGELLVADLKRTLGSGFDRMPADTPVHQRTLVEEARRRATRLDED